MATTKDRLEILLREAGLIVLELIDKTVVDEGVCYVLNDAYELGDPGEQFFVVAAVPEYGKLDPYIQKVWNILVAMNPEGFEPLSYTANYSTIAIPGRQHMQRVDIAVLEVSSNVRL